MNRGALFAVLALALAAGASAQTPVPGITSPSWLERPTGEHFAAVYPREAIVSNTEGRVVLNCLVRADGLDCAVMSEDPAGLGFAKAAMELSVKFRMAPVLSNGTHTEGGRVYIPINFRLR